MNRLVDKLVRGHVVRSLEVKHVLLRLDRSTFCPRTYDPELPYEDHPLAIGMGQTISAPHVHALALEAARDRLLEVTDRQVAILDVGSGSGYLTGAFALLIHEMGRAGRVVGIEKYQELVEASLESLEVAGLGKLLRSGAIEVKQANGYEYESGQKFDFIHAGAAAEFIPDNLVEALTEGGQLLLPLGPHGGIQEMTLVTKHKGQQLTTQDLMSVRYVPLQIT
jgi:protein-L-isoaspartate(D-aspartate) O-methyltransferase